MAKRFLHTTHKFIEARDSIRSAVDSGAITRDEFEDISARWYVEDVKAAMEEVTALIVAINESGLYKIEATSTKLQ